MQLRNLEPAARQGGYLNRLVPSTFEINTREVFMNDKDKTVSPLSIDHCHKTGKIRGLLCNSCNRALGFFYEELESLENAILYLRRHLSE